MNDDALRAVWTSSQPTTKEVLLATIDAVLDEDRVAREKDRLVRLAALTAMALLCPALLWFAAYGKTPLVRGGYALMALGTSLILFAEWMHRTLVPAGFARTGGCPVSIAEDGPIAVASGQPVQDGSVVVRPGFCWRVAHRSVALSGAQQRRGVSSVGEHRRRMVDKCSDWPVERQEARQPTIQDRAGAERPGIVASPAKRGSAWSRLRSKGRDRPQ